MHYARQKVAYQNLFPGLSVRNIWLSFCLVISANYSHSNVIWFLFWCYFSMLLYWLFVFLQLIGVAILGFSIYLRVDYWLNQYVAASDELTKYTVAVYIFIAMGSVIILFCIVGIYGAIRPDKAALIVVSG